MLHLQFLLLHLHLSTAEHERNVLSRLQLCQDSFKQQKRPVTLSLGCAVMLMFASLQETAHVEYRNVYIGKGH